MKRIWEDKLEQFAFRGEDSSGVNLHKDKVVDFIKAHFLYKGTSLSDPIVTTGKELKKMELFKIIDELPDPSTLPFEHNEYLKDILKLLVN